VETPAKLFGSVPRTKIILAVALLKETYPRELARALDIPLLTAQRVLNDYEREGILASRIVGNNRMFSLNARMYGAPELESFLKKYARRTEVETSLSQLRRRPRRAGKVL
jgi:DNA-binding transcriptional ArsR family regulator